MKIWTDMAEFQQVQKMWKIHSGVQYPIYQNIDTLHLNMYIQNIPMHRVPEYDRSYKLLFVTFDNKGKRIEYQNLHQVPAYCWETE